MAEIYIAGKCDSDEMDFKDLAGKLEDAGHSIPMKWWELPKLGKPYLDHYETSRGAAGLMIDAARDCDVLVLNTEGNILGAAIEFGAGLASIEQRPDKIINLVGAYASRQSVFYAHEQVVHLPSLQDVLHQPWV